MISPLKERLALNQRLFGTMVVEFHTPNLMVILQASGFDFLIIDCEHGYFDYAMVASLITVAKGKDIPVLVRVPGPERDCILKYLEMGASGIIVPMIETADEVRRSVEYCRYAPLGRRGVSTVRAHTDYHPGDIKKYMNRANDQIVLFVQIESRKGLEHIEDIVKVNGLDGLILGPNDLAQDMGIIDEKDSSLLQEAFERVTAIAAENGKFSGIITSNIDWLKACGQRGMQLLSWSSEVGMLMQGAKDGLNRLKGKEKL